MSGLTTDLQTASDNVVQQVWTITATVEISKLGGAEQHAGSGSDSDEQGRASISEWHGVPESISQSGGDGEWEVVLQFGGDERQGVNYELCRAGAADRVFPEWRVLRRARMWSATLGNRELTIGSAAIGRRPLGDRRYGWEGRPTANGSRAGVV